MSYTKSYYSASQSIINIITLITILSISNNVNAKIVVYSFEEKVNRSDVIAIGKIIKITKNIFTKDEIIIDIIELIKGDISKKQIEIEYGNYFFAPKEDLSNFVDGGKYVFFITQDESSYYLTGASSGYYQILEKDMICFDEKKIKIEDFKKTINNESKARVSAQ